MRRLRVLVWRIRALFRKGQLEGALDEELRFHLEMEADRLVRSGVDPEEARLLARRNFGGVEQIKEIYRDRRGLPGVELLGRDLGHAWRSLRRHPGFTAAAVLSLALGIGANTAVFSLLDALVLRPLPYPNPDRLVHIYEAGLSAGRFRWGSVAAPVLRDWRERARSFTAMGAFLPTSVNLAGPDGAVRVAATAVEPEVFHALNVPPLHGRLFRPEHTTRGMERVVVLSHRLWQDQFGGRHDVIGQTLRIDAADHAVVGVMPAGFEFPPRTSVGLYLPLTLTSLDFQDRGLKRLSVIARVKPGVPMRAAHDDMASVSRQLEAMYPNSRSALLRPLHGDTVWRTALVLVVLGDCRVCPPARVRECGAHGSHARANARRHSSRSAWRSVRGAARSCECCWPRDACWPSGVVCSASGYAGGRLMPCCRCLGTLSRSA
jgi:hypothetical protein